MILQALGKVAAALSEGNDFFPSVYAVNSRSFHVARKSVGTERLLNPGSRFPLCLGCIKKLFILFENALIRLISSWIFFSSRIVFPWKSP